MKKKYEEIKSALLKVEIQLDEEQGEKEKLKREYAELKQTLDKMSS